MNTTNNKLYQIKELPLPSYKEQALLNWNLLLESLQYNTLISRDIYSFFVEAKKPCPLNSLLECIFGVSLYVSQLIIRYPELSYYALTSSPHDLLLKELEQLRAACPADSTRQHIFSQMRIRKQRFILILSIADLAGYLHVMETTKYLTLFADTVVQIALEHLCLKAITNGHLKGVDPEHPSKDSGLFVIAMGKMGAFELNYSSDIDIIVLFDPEKVTYSGKKSLSELYIRITKDLSCLLQDYSSEGYVCRVDLRLRPDAGVTQPAISVIAAENYYESYGQNWERAAMIKARIIAGDFQAGKVFLEKMRPFIWRKYLDFATIEDIQSLKRQFHAVRGHRNLAVEGHNIKMGYGGIREVEMFVQTQQLIMGGREVSLRQAGTCDALNALVSLKQIKSIVRNELLESYYFLRNLEHRLQMINDEQTHMLPKDSESMVRLAYFCGYSSYHEFVTAIKYHLKLVNKHYSYLFKSAPTLSSDIGNLVFTGTDDDPGTIKTLQELGYNNPKFIIHSIRTWHYGRFKSAQGTRSQQMLTSAVPTILHMCSETTRPDEVFIGFYTFVEHLPSGVQIFKIIAEDVSILERLCYLLHTAPNLASSVGRSPQVLDVFLLSQPTLGQPTLQSQKEMLTNFVAKIPDGDRLIAQFRRFANSRRAHIGVQWLFDPESRAQRVVDYSDVADLICHFLYMHVMQEFTDTYGVIPDSEFAIIGLGTFGSREMTLKSDLDLVFIYRTGEETMSNGQQSISAPHYFVRLSQQFISLLQIENKDGLLYEVDTRLRPSGHSGPLAVSFERFSDYYGSESWTWEYMALTRARVITGSQPLLADISRHVDHVLQRKKDPQKTIEDVVSMRDKVRKTIKPQARMYGI